MSSPSVARPQPGGGRCAWLYLCAALVAVALSTRAPDSVQLAMLSLVQLSGGLAVWAGLRLHRPAHPGGWRLFGVAGILFGAGTAAWWVYGALLHLPVPYPGWPDAFFVPAYLAYAAGLAVMVRRQTPGGDVPAVLDAAVLATGAAFANWVFLTGPTVAGGALTPGQQVITLGYPLIDVVIVALVARLLLGGDRSVPALWLLAAGLVANLGGDTAYAVVSVHGGYHPGALPDQLWMLNLVLVGTAALHPGMIGVTRAATDGTDGTAGYRLTFMTASLAVLPVAAGARAVVGGTLPSAAVALAAATVCGLAGTRVTRLARTLRASALRDPLTGLPNRNLFTQRVEKAFDGRDGTARSGPGALLFVDLDGFKGVNDTYGHDAGDRLLEAVSGRLAGAVRDGDTVARLGGDEFAVLCAGAGPEEGEAAAARVVAALTATFQVDGHTILIGASVGLVDLAVHGSADEALRDADLAMYAAKARGRGRWERYTPALRIA